MNRLAISLAALTFSLSAPTLALAETGSTKAETFRSIVDSRIENARERLAKILDQRDLPAAQETAMKQDFERGVEIVNAAVADASADGTVTQQEARTIRELVKDRKELMRQKHGKAIAR